MEIWLDTCDQKAIAEAARFGIVYGITSNPTILAEAEENPDAVISAILNAQEGPMAIQVTAEDAPEIIKQAIDLHAYSKRIVVKIPVTKQGLIAMKNLTEINIPIMATAVFEPKQVLLAALAGAHYVAPYLGRMFDAGIDAYASLQSMVNILHEQDFHTKILVAALRTTEQIIACAEMGIGAITLKNSLFLQFLNDEPLTMDSLQGFAQDWNARDFQFCKLLV